MFWSRYIHRKDHYVIKVDDHAYIKKVMENLIEHFLKNCWGISWPMGKIFIVAIMIVKCSFPFVSRFYVNQGLGATPVNFFENLGTAEIISGYLFLSVKAFRTQKSI